MVVKKTYVDEHGQRGVASGLARKFWYVSNDGKEEASNGQLQVKYSLPLG